MKLRAFLLTFILTGTVTVSVLSAGEIGFVEKFALSDNREATLASLVPGTEDYYYFHCLYYEQVGNREKLNAVLKQWTDRLGETKHAKEIRNRQALLDYPKNSRQTLDYLKQELGLHFDHQREVPGAKPNLPTALDAQLITPDAFRAQALARSNTLSGITDEGLEQIVRTKTPLDTARRRDLLQRIRRPDVPELLAIIASDLTSRESGGFGEFPIHSQLLLAQMEELLKVKPDLLADEAFIAAYLRKLQPNADVDWQHDLKEREAYLNRLWTFVSRLLPSQNSLKAHVLFQRLEHDRKIGTYDRPRFIEYLKIPKPGPWIRPEYLQSEGNDRYPADLSTSFETALPIIGNDEPLIRDYLLHFFSAENSYADFAPFLREDRLKPLIAEAHILAGTGDLERWTSFLSPAEFQALKDRVDLEFAVTNPATFSLSDPVKLEVSLKNTGKILVKIYEINTLQFYLRTPEEIGTDLDLDGLVANEEQTHSNDQPPLRRTKRTFDFPSLAGKRGVWVVEFIGNGQSSRALVRKGQLHSTCRQSVAGTTLTVLDEANHPVPNASIWVAGRKYAGGKNGEVVIPFTTLPGEKSVVLEAAGFASLETIDFPAEQYAFSAQFQISQEQIVPGQKATVAIRPDLSINHTPAPLKALEETTLTITATDREGIASTQVISPFLLPTEGVALHEFLVPDRLANLSFTLSAKIENISAWKKENLTFTTSIETNRIDATDHTDTSLLLRDGSSYFLEVRGKNGERRVDRAVSLALRRTGFVQPVETTLKTDANGRVALGKMDGITGLNARIIPGPDGSWSLDSNLRSHPEAIQAQSDQPIFFPLTTGVETLSDFSLLEIRGGLFAGDLASSLKLIDGFLAIGPLQAGDYSLALRRENKVIAVRVSEPANSDAKTPSNRLLEMRGPSFLQLFSAKKEGEEIVIRLANADRGSRVHLLTSRYVPEGLASPALFPPPDPDPGYSLRQNLDTLYLSGRSIGDEYRYILDRRNATKFPGNMLTRPGLLLNPWALRDTETAVETAQAGEQYQKLEQPSASSNIVAGMDAAGMRAKEGPPPRGFFANLDFLGSPAPAIYNLEPDSQGIVRIPIAKLGGRQELHIVATDARTLLQRSLILDAPKILFTDVRLGKALNPKENFTQRRTITPLDSGQTVNLANASSGEAEIYDSTLSVYRLFRNLSNDPALAEFSFLPDWPKLSDAEKREKYSRFACHEFHFWLSRKDPAFFDSVVKPFLANKRDRTFMDRYLLGEDLARYLDPWAFEQLNLVEQILLGRRIAKERPSIARRVADLLEMQPSVGDQESFLFDSALRGNALINNSGGFARGLAESAAVSIAPAGPASEKIARRLSKSEADSLDQDATISAPAEGSEREKQSFFEENSAKDKKDLERRDAVRSFFRKLDPTKEWAENNYYKLPLSEQGPGLIAVNAFWKDFADWNGEGPFLSKHFPECHHRFTEMILAMALLDLPFEAATHRREAKDRGVVLRAASPAILFHTEIESASTEPGPATLLASESFFRRDDRYRMENGEQTDKLVSDEFLTGVVYGAQVVITNPTSTRRKVDLLAQIPQGAIPVSGSRGTINRVLRLQPFATERVEYFFYFPEAGNFSHYPAHLAKDGRGIASAEPTDFRVVENPSKVDTDSWQYLSQNGSPEQVLTYLETANLTSTPLPRIAWRMRDPVFFRKTLELLRRRHSFSPELWSYSILHNDREALRNYLPFANAFVANCGSWLKSDLLTINPIDRRAYQHLEYSPFISARTYALGENRRIVNEAIYSQYTQLLNIFAHQPSLDDEDRLASAYYLLLQGRTEEGLTMFDRVTANKISEQIQYDYLRTFVNFYRENLAEAREIATRYAEYSVPHWKKLFGEVIAQLDEAEGKTRTSGSGKASDLGRDLALEELSGTEPSFDLKLEGKQIEIESQNLTELTLNFYRMDLELLFSTNPFVSSDASRFAIIRPNKTLTIQVPAGKEIFAEPLPDEFRDSNVLVEGVGAGITKAQPSYANRMNIQLVSTYGRLQVLDSQTRKPLAKAYVKVYSRTGSGEIRFHKDGYTDLRGKFDYASVSGPDAGDVSRFAILILSETNGAAVREVDPPAQ